MEVAALGLKVDGAEGIEKASKALDGLASSAEKAQASTDGLGRGVGVAGDGAGRLKKSVDDANKSTDSFRQSASDAGKSADALGRSSQASSVLMAELGKAAYRAGALIGAALSFNALKNYADAWSDMQSQVGAATNDMAGAGSQMQRLVDIANASYSPLQQTVQTYAQNVSTLRDLGKSSAEAADYTESLNHMLVLTATRGERAASVQNALSKAMAVGKLQADGLETILANGGEVAQALATELGTTVNNLRSFATQGKITGDVIANAIIKPLDSVRERAADMPATLADAFQRVNNNLTEFVGRIDKASGASSALAELIIDFSDGIRTATNYVIAFGQNAAPVFDLLGSALKSVAKYSDVAFVAVAGFAAPALLGGVTSLTVAIGNGLVGAIKAVTALMMANPIGLLVAALATAGYAAYKFRDEIKEAVGVDVVGITKTAANTVIGSFVAAYEDIKFLWSSFGDMMGAAVVGGVNAAIRAINSLIQGAISGINSLIESLNKIPVLDLNIGLVDQGRGIQEIANTYTDALAAAMADRDKAISEALSKDYLGTAAEFVSSLFDLRDAADSAAGASGGGKGGIKGLTDQEKKLAKAFDDRIKSLKEAYESERESLEILQEYGAAAKNLTEIDREVIKAEKDLAQAQTATQKSRAQAILSMQKARQEQEKAANAIKKAIDMEQAHADAIRETIKANGGASEDLQKRIDQLQEEIGLIGASAKAVSDANVAKIRSEANWVLQKAETLRLYGAEADVIDGLILRYQQLMEVAALEDRKSTLEFEEDFSKKQREEYDGWLKSIDDSAREAFLSIGDQGVDAFERIGRSIKTAVLDLIYQMTLKPIIVNIVGSVTGGPGGWAQDLMGGGQQGSTNWAQLVGGRGGLGNVLSFAPGSGGFGGAIGSFQAGMAGGWHGFTGGISMMQNGSYLAGGMQALGAAAPYIAALYQLGQGKTGSAAGTAIGAYVGSIVPVIGTAIGALIGGFIGSFADFTATPHGGAVSWADNYGFGGHERPAWHRNGYMPEVGENLYGLGSGIASSLGALIETFEGVSRHVVVMTEWQDDWDGKGPSWGDLRIIVDGADLVNWGEQYGRGRFGEARHFSGKEEGWQEYIAAVAQDYVAALQQIDIPGWAKGVLDGIGKDASLEQITTALAQIAAMNATFASWTTYLKEFADVGDETFSKLIDASGGFDPLAANVSTFIDRYYKPEEKVELQRNQLTDALGAQGIALPSSMEEYRAMVEAALAGGPETAQTAALLLALAGSFADYHAAMEALGGAVTDTGEAISSTMRGLLEERAKLEADLLLAQGDDEGYAAAIRAIDTQGMTEAEIAAYDYNQALRDQIVAYRAAAEAAAQVESQRKSLEQQIFELTASNEEIRRAELEAMDESLRPLQERVWAIKDEQAAAAAAAQAEQQRASQRQSLEQQILQLEGNTAAIRQLELAALDESLRPLQERIYALQDEAAAAAAAAQLAQQRQSLEMQILQLEGNTAEIRRRELEALDASLRPLQERIWLLRDEQAAAQEAARAAAEAQRAAEQAEAERRRAAEQAQRDAENAIKSLAQKYASALQDALGALTNSGSLIDQIDAALGGSGDAYSRMREQRLWEAMQGADYQQQIELAGELTNLVLDRYNTEKSAIQSQISAARQLRDYVRDLRVGDLSTATLGEKLQQSATTWDQTLAAARAGDAEALSKLSGLSTEYLQLARQYYASSDQYASIFDNVTGSLDALGISTEQSAASQHATAEASLGALQNLQSILQRSYEAAEIDVGHQQMLLSQQLSALGGIEGGIDTIASILAGLPAEIAVHLGGYAAGSGYTAPPVNNNYGGGGSGGGTGTGYGTGAGTGTPSGAETDGLAGMYRRMLEQGQMLRDAATRTDLDLSSLGNRLEDARAEQAAASAQVCRDMLSDGAQMRDQQYNSTREIVANNNLNTAQIMDWSVYSNNQAMTGMVEEIKGLRSEVAQLRADQQQQSDQQVAATIGAAQSSAETISSGVQNAAAKTQYSGMIAQRAKLK